MQRNNALLSFSSRSKTMILFDSLGEFVQQIPISLIIQVCISALLLITAFVYFAFIKPRRKKAQEKVAQAMAAPAEAIMAAPAITIQDSPLQAIALSVEEDDLMPDLNLLLDTSTLRKEAPVIPPAQLTAKPTISRGSGTYRVKLRSGETVEAKEIVAVLRDPRDGRLIVHIENVGYRSLVDSPEVKEKFVKVMRELSDVVTKADENPPAPIAEELAAEQPKLGASIEPKPAAPRTASSPPPLDASGKIPGALPTYKIEDGIKPQKSGFLGGRAKFESVPIPELNIAAAIETYLQHKLRHTDGYEGRSIHVLSAPGGGVSIEVDGTHYDSVGDVADDEVRAFLAETIQEWQDRQ